MGEIEEACPDIEVVINIWSGGNLRNSFEISINKGRFVKELKQCLSGIPEVAIHQSSMRIYAGDTELKDDCRILDYDVETDDELTLEDLTVTGPPTTPISELWGR